MTANLLAREILGLDFISPQEIAAARGLNYSVEQIAELERTLPDKETLEWLKQSGYMLVAGSPHRLPFLGVHQFGCSCFLDRRSRWHRDRAHANDLREIVTGHWYMFRKNIIPNFVRQEWCVGSDPVCKFEQGFDFAGFVWVMECYAEVNKVSLPGRFYILCKGLMFPGINGLRNHEGGRFVAGYYDSTCLACSNSQWSIPERKWILPLEPLLLLKP